LLHWREVNVIASVAVGAMTSLLLLVIMYTDTQNDGQNDQSHNLLQCSLRSHLAEIITKLCGAVTTDTSSHLLL